MRRLLSVLLACLLAAAPAAAQTRDWPRIVGSANGEVCRQALQLGEAAFRSTAPEMAPDAPAGFASRVLLRQVKSYSEGGDGIWADEGVFDVAKGTAAAAGVFWQRQAVQGRRFVVMAEPFGWRGDAFSAYVVDAGMKADDLPSSYRGGSPPAGVVRLTETTRRAPIVLQDRRGGATWLIDVDAHSGLGAPDWGVHTLERGQPCRVVFHPPMASDLALLPKPARRFAARLDEALGPGRNEGTLQSTAWIRARVAREWLNASLRPWALTDPPYNTTAEVEAGLAAWAKGERRRAAVRREILALRPQVARAMGDFYAARFKLSGTEARAAGRYATDHLLRSYFVFHVEGRDPSVQLPVTNPWPAGVR